MNIKKTTGIRTLLTLDEAEHGETYWAPSDHGAVAVTKLDPNSFEVAGHHVVWLFPNRSVYAHFTDFDAKGIVVTEFDGNDILTLGR